MASAFVQTKENDSGFSSSAAIVITMDFAYGAGNAAIVHTHDGDNGIAFPTLVDNKGNTYVEVTAARVSDSVNNNKLTSFYAENLGGAGAAQLTLSWASAVGFRAIICSEYSGIKTSSSLVGGSGLQQSGVAAGTDNISSGNINFTSQPALLAAYGRDDSGGTQTPAAGTGFTSRGTDGINATRWEDRRVTVTGNAAALFSSIGTSNYNVTAVGLLEIPPAPTIDSQPQDVRTVEGQTATFSVSATTSGGALTYQWQRDDGAGFNNVGGATSSSYTTPTLTVASDNGDLYRCQVTDDNATTASANAFLGVEVARRIRVVSSPMRW